MSANFEHYVTYGTDPWHWHAHMPRVAIRLACSPVYQRTNDIP